MTTRLTWFVACVVLLLPRPAWAHAEIRSLQRGAGFLDPRPLAPSGGNPGTTLGEQRRLALEHALALWGKRIESSVPIVVQVDFDDMGCRDAGVVLASAGPVDAFSGLSAEGADPALFYPSALADSLSERDRAPGRPDIGLSINSAIDSGTCTLGKFYYGLDGKPGDGHDFVEILLHELAHGLGIASLVEPESGELFMYRGLDPYSAQLRDLDLDRNWTELNAAERKRSASNVRRVVWDGPLAARLVPQTLARGEPALAFDRNLPEYSGFVSDVEFAASPARAPVSGALVAATGCSLAAPPGDTAWIALFSACGATNAARAAEQAGAAGAVVVSRSRFAAPAEPIDTGRLASRSSIPMVAVTQADADAIQRAHAIAPLRAALAGDPERYLGSDARARPLLFATRPADSGSSISHVESLMRPNQLMEAFASELPRHDLDFTLALLHDFGWPQRCGNARLDAAEECDAGELNSDSAADGCRTDCRAASCGDGVRDRDEDCDDGAANSDTRPDGCRSDCTRAACGDGVLDKHEQCDRGDDNDDRRADACRSDCRRAHCGDGVVDGIEQCDRGRDNDDSSADACRSDCRLPRCGDAVADTGEACDEGANNGDRVEHACRRDCTRAGCGDGILDVGEECDGTSGCAPACRLTPPEPPTSPASEQEPLPDASVKHDAGEAEAVAAPEADAGCDCRLAQRSTRGRSSALVLAALLLIGLRRRRRRAACLDKSGVHTSAPGHDAPGTS